MSKREWAASKAAHDRFLGGNMEFVIVKNCTFGEDNPYPETINIESIVSFNNETINLSNGKYVPIVNNTYKEIKEYLTKKGHSIVKIGD